MGQPHIYLIPGLGADDRLFQRLILENKNITKLKWIRPLKNETLESYCQRFSKLIDQENEIILIGVSLGGIVAQELSHLVNAKMIILVSSILNCSELPWYLTALKKSGIYKMVPSLMVKKLGIGARFVLGSEYKEGIEIFKSMLNDSDDYFLEWGLTQALCWEGRKPKCDVKRIHGTKDLVFPPGKTSETTMVKDGNHFMVFNKAEEVSAYINKILKAGK